MHAHSHPFFEDVEPRHVELILSQSRMEAYAKDCVIFDEGAPSDALYLVIEGKVAFQKQIRGKEWLTVNESVAGSYFGEIGVLSGEPRALRALAKSNVKIVRISGSALVDFLKSISGPMEKLLQSVIQHLRHTTDHYIDDRLQQEKMAMVGSMMNTIIHDFKNPFCLISLSAQMLRQKHPDTDTERYCLGIEKQVDRMVAMATELGEFSRGEQNLVKTALQLDELFEEFKNLNFPYFEYRNIDITIEIPPIEIQASKAKLFRVFQNLIGNAIEALSDKEGFIRIRAKLFKRNKWVRISIEDNAGGIPESIRDRFFEPFVTFGKREGTGLGTAIARSIVEAHGGSIDFETETGKGTCFIIELPLG